MENGKKDIPTDKVLALRNQNLSDNQIIQSLQHDGYTSQQVIQALELADQKHSSAPQPPNQSFSPPPPQNNMQGQPQNMAPPSASPERDNSDIEELIEAIIEEKWATVEEDMNKVLEWKDTVDETIIDMQSDFKNIKTNFDDLHKAILGKVGDYDKNILQVGTQLKAMEEVFSKVLPTFTDNVAELDRIANKLNRK